VFSRAQNDGLVTDKQKGAASFPAGSLSKLGVGNPSEAGQKRISVEQETVQQLRGWDVSLPHRSRFEVCPAVILHPDILAQQSGAFVTVITFGLAISGQRNVTTQMMNKALRPALRMTD
jgi:hypothetical protein